MRATDRRTGEPTTVNAVPPSLTEFRPTTVLALGGLVACALFALQDPAVRDGCLRVAKDGRLRQGILDALKGLGREPTSELG